MRRRAAVGKEAKGNARRCVGGDGVGRGGE